MIMMNPQPNVSLRDHSTMGLGGEAAYLVEVNERMQVLEALSWAQNNGLPSMMIGSGSNIVWPDIGYKGLVIVNKIQRYEVFEEDDVNVYLTIGGGENWDSVVARSVVAGLTGIEALSLIPGTAGATPIQNVGAYGQDISQTLTTVEAFDTKVGDFVTIAGTDCGFGYRTSRFKTNDKGRFYITSITLHLIKGNPQPPFYDSVRQYFEDHNVSEFTPAAVREAVISIRSEKLPDPQIINNCGSFFANPIVTDAQYHHLSTLYENVPHWPAGEGMVKLSGAWLIEKAGFKDNHDEVTGMGTWAKQPLVLINEHANKTADLLNYKQKITDAIRDKFDVALVQEPELVS